MNGAAPALEQALERLRAADRRRRFGRRCWFALGGAAFATAICWALAHAPTGTFPPAVIIALAAVAAVTGFLAGRSEPLPDEALARSVDEGSELPQMALTVVAPLAPTPGGLDQAVREQTEQELTHDERRHYLPVLPRVLWPAIGTGAAICFYLLLPSPPDPNSLREQAGSPPQVRQDPGEGAEGEGNGGDASAGGSAREGAGDPPKEPSAGATPQAQPQPQPQNGGGNAQPQPKDSPSNNTPGDGSSELYGDPDRLKVNKEKLKVDSLFDESEEGVKRTVMLPDPPKPKKQPAGRDRPRGTVPDEIKRADEAALSERITDPAERDTVQRYFELLNAGATEPKKK